MLLGPPPPPANLPMHLPKAPSRSDKELRAATRRLALAKQKAQHVGASRVSLSSAVSEDLVAQSMQESGQL